jgi:branched-subunit amino acid transport protein AzlD
MMKKQFIKATSGWIPVSLLVMLTIALIAGQARANLPNEVRAVPAPVAVTLVNAVPSADMLKKLALLSFVVDTMLALPSDFELTIDEKILSVDKRDERHPGQSPVKSQ